MDTNTILSFIEEIKTDHNAFVNKRVAKEVTKTQLRSIIKDMGLFCDVNSAYSVLTLHSANHDQRRLSEEFVRRLLSQSNVLLVISNYGLLLDGKDENSALNLLRKYLALEEVQLGSLVTALQREAGVPAVEPRSTMATKIKMLMPGCEVITVEVVLEALDLRGNKENTNRVKKALEKLANDGFLCYNNSTPKEYRKAV